MNRIVKFATPMFAAALIAGTLAGCGGQAASSSASASAESASASASATAPASPSAETQATAEETVAQLKAAMEGAKDFKSVTVTHTVGVEMAAPQPEESASAESASAESASAESASASAAESAESASASAAESAESASASAAESADSASAESAESADSAAASEAATEDESSYSTTTVYKFDQSGEAVKASSTSDFLGSTFKSYIDGGKAVVEVDGDAYAGTIEEMSAQELTSIDELLNTKIGDFETLMSCVSSADVATQGDNTVYALAIDPDKYVESDEVEKAIAEAGLKKEVFTISYEFGADGKLLSVSYNTVTPMDTTQATLNFTDYDATVVDQAPEANKTYADMSAEIQAVVDEIAGEEQAASESK